MKAQHRVGPGSTRPPTDLNGPGKPAEAAHRGLPGRVPSHAVRRSGRAPSRRTRVARSHERGTQPGGIPDASPDYPAVIDAVFAADQDGSATQGGTRASGRTGIEGAQSRSAADLIPRELAENPDYEIIRKLGSGGMGVVFLAHNRIMGRDEVLKVISREIVETPDVLERFRREIRAVGSLQHPNIVTAYTAFTAGASLVFAMEYVEGLDLARLVKAKGPMSVGHACSFVHQTALGLQHAHEAGMVHRDIKPDNLMLTHEDGPGDHQGARFRSRKGDQRAEPERTGNRRIRRET